MKPRAAVIVLAASLLALAGCQHPAGGTADAATAQPAPAKPAPATPKTGTPPTTPKTAPTPTPAKTAPAPATKPATKPPTKPPITDPDRYRIPKGEGDTVNRITIYPAHPRAGQTIHVAAGPVVFRTTCEGVASVKVTTKDKTVTVAWTHKKVPPGTMCGMIVRALPITAVIPGLPAGHYTLVVTEIGKRPLVVAP